MSEVLWKRLNTTDFNGMNGQAAPSQTGGGARHIVLGKSRLGNNVESFLGPMNGANKTISVNGADLTFDGNPDRRNGEWRIQDQKTHRHPAWSKDQGFPEIFDETNPPVIFVFKLKDVYHAKWIDNKTFETLAPELAKNVRGVDKAPQSLLARFDLSNKSTFDEFEEDEPTLPDEEFDPNSVEEGRRRVLAEVVRRQGQRKFRQELITAYSGQCAITGCTDIWVLEAAHITPYRGPDTNASTNGILLRADIHTLFDLGLIAINPDDNSVHVSSKVVDPNYLALAGNIVSEGKPAASKLALQDHFNKREP